MIPILEQLDKYEVQIRERLNNQEELPKRWFLPKEKIEKLTIPTLIKIFEDEEEFKVDFDCEEGENGAQWLEFSENVKTYNYWDRDFYGGD